jgi:hypothetical protein
MGTKGYEASHIADKMYKKQQHINMVIIQFLSRNTGTTILENDEIDLIEGKKYFRNAILLCCTIFVDRNHNIFE